MRITSQYFWSIIFLVFFLCLVFMATVILESEAVRTYEVLALVDYVLITLASFRLVRLIIHDRMFSFFREQFYDVTEYKGKIVLAKPEGGPRRALADLVLCPWSLGMFSVFVVSFLYMLTAYAFYPTILLALSGVVALIQLLANVIGWKAEQVKYDVEGR